MRSGRGEYNTGRGTDIPVSRETSFRFIIREFTLEVQQLIAISLKGWEIVAGG